MFLTLVAATPPCAYSCDSWAQLRFLGLRVGRLVVSVNAAADFLQKFFGHIVFTDAETSLWCFNVITQMVDTQFFYVSPMDESRWPGPFSECDTGIVPGNFESSDGKKGYRYCASYEKDNAGC